MTPTEAFLEARDFLLSHREDYATAYAGFRWPRLETFNWALDHFDVQAEGNPTRALWIVEDGGGETAFTYAQLRARSNQAANLLHRQGVKRGDRLLLMLPNVAPLWEAMLAAMKVGAVLIPATTQLTGDDLKDRLERGQVRHVLTDAAGAEKFDALGGKFTRLIAGAARPGWVSWSGLEEEAETFTPGGVTRASDPLLLYFTSGTTSRPKLVLHTHQSYPVGHLSTMYWLGLRPGDVHWNISSPGWAKHAWSNVFAPWNAGATVFVFNQARFSAARTLEVLEQYRVQTLCAPPTVWRMLILEDLQRHRVFLREVVGAGEPLNPEIIERVRAGWGLTIRDGYGQTETTCQIGNSPGQPLKPGSMGRPLPGYRIDLRDDQDQSASEGEICLPLDPRPLPLMAEYHDDSELTATAMRHAHYHTGDVASRDEDGYLTHVGRADDVFKSSDYRISPFELESVLLEHPLVAESAVVPSPDPVRLAVPKAYVVLKPGVSAEAATAKELFRFVRDRLAPFKRIRRLEFAELPKTISGKIRRVELRRREVEAHHTGRRAEGEFWLEDFPELKDAAG